MHVSIAKETSLPTSHVMETHLGPLSYEPEKHYLFEQGIPGFLARQEFVIGKLAKVEKFSILYSLTNSQCSFLVMPQPINTPLIAEPELQEILENLCVSKEGLSLFYITTVKKDQNLRQVKLNQKAPIILDEERKLGWQYIISNPAYRVDLPLS